MVAVYEDDENPKTLCDWVRNFRLKKVQMKRKLRSGGSNLRVCAILTTALISAEHELRRKQQERFNRWCEIQSKFDKNFANNAAKTYIRTCSSYDNNAKQQNAAQCALRVEQEQKQREEINNIWNYELKDLDEFMRSFSSSGRNGEENSSSNSNNNNSACGSSENCFNSMTHDNSIKVSS